MVAGAFGFDESDTALVANEPADQLILFHRSDGDPNARPSATQLDRRRGKDNYHRKVHVNEPAGTAWRAKVGKALQRDLDLDPAKQWYLADWPPNYELFVHVNKERHDLYLFGGPARFRSANEFYPHARWLLTDPTLNRSNCHCKYCSGSKSQQYVNFREGIGPPPAPPVPKVERIRPTAGASTSGRTHRGHVRRAAAPVVVRAPRTPAKPVVPTVKQLEAEVRSARWFRVGEVVWVRVDPPIRPRDCQSDQQLEWWPALIHEPKLKSVADPHEPGKQGWGVTQFTAYRVQILGLMTQYVVPDTSILPYQAYIPPTEIIDRLTIVMTDLDPPLDTAGFAHFLPMPNPLQTPTTPRRASLVPTKRKHEDGEDEALYDEASAPFAFALQIAGEITTQWCATDSFEATFSDSPTPQKQLCFQGLWWGPERMWVGDLVRVKPGRRQLHGSLLPPSSPEAGERGLFLQITRIYRERETGEDGNPTSRGMVAGILYEVAEAPPTLDDTKPSGSETKAKPILRLVSLPDAPPGYHFRHITPTLEHEICLPLDIIAGRYYPSLPASPLLSKVYNPITLQIYILSIPIENPAEIEHPRIVTCVKNLLGLFGLRAGNASAIDTGSWKAGRRIMLTDAWDLAKRELDGFLAQGAERRNTTGQAESTSTVNGVKEPLLDVELAVKVGDAKVKAEPDAGPASASGMAEDGKETFCEMALSGGLSEEDVIILD
ncbi:hypothetical protein FRB94_000443 [Tulasnella sp. JGI-2019a]|nr:hypothetical protein FRB94_000443 [Tulasnella sp. JGI-2019a]KAG9010338.1 hypothetical protein FRB93_004177 [Tulasnella sp. JGI-2019a]KAG9038628.1 hypothetical protein FRB95_000217 [Tulasnella sp. JGI-2019a]